MGAFRGEYTEELKHELEGIMKDMRQSLSGNKLVENGHDRGKCGGCRKVYNKGNNPFLL
ncbi:hypothetical protein J4212_06235 [Candidatus Woesearchaeota archaeon]|nr:hypothetical protein [Candidatus Woesearchaeota archaeon]